MSGGVPPSSRARITKPSQRHMAKQAQRAALLYEQFTGHDAVEAVKVRVPDLPKSVAVIGDCDGVLYTTVRDGKTEKYIHKFARKDRPLLCVAPDGSQILLIGGNYTFTERGIVDKSYRG
jgi:hypothetical protein